MSYSMSGETVAILAQTVSGFEQMQQDLHLTLQDQTLYVWCFDHDNTTHFQALLPLLGTPSGEDVCSTLYFSCETLQQSLQSLQGRLQIQVAQDHWDLQDVRGHRVVWQTQPCPVSRAFLGTLLFDSDCRLSVPTTDFLLYVQQLAVCEGPVEVSSPSPGNLRFCARGELVDIQIETSGTDPTKTLLASAVVGLKYIRAVLPSLVQAPTLDIYIRNQEAVILQAVLPSHRLYLILKGQCSL